ncbi:DNA mismatch repair protein MutS [Flavobacterium sp. xlx-214]|uniref:MutS-related protein n=1 Tax=unclassified Flavobacterium TaxID=196869 RepID=UPI0013CFBD46|nr:MULTISPECIES: DNA mismatch repair protein MutS [unclassified Flavobacterium]MBA5792557.1 DNA mismatch repair protein MutS [Flavobacterium sp. xlx-221]QMI83707.1 DNA mismatch repair protein MutS [Flavobacterium sp. xlx-214]
MYQDISNQQKQILKKLTSKKTVLSWFRLVFLIVAVYLFYLMMYQKNETMGWWAFLALLLFIIAVNVYLKLQTKISYHKTLQKINDDEIDFLKGAKTFDEGNEFLNPQHAYSYDLDLFGKNSIFQFINRTGTSLGKKQLAKDLQTIPTEDVIKLRQEAVQELTQQFDFRQQFQTLALLADTSEKEDNAIEQWTKSKSDNPNKLIQVAVILVPVLFLLSLLASIFNWHPLASKFTLFFFSFNLLIAGFMTQFIMKEIGKGDKIANSLQQYAKMIKLFEVTSFQSKYLQEKQNQLKNNNKTATEIVDELANLFEKLNTIANLFIFIAFNGTFQYHFWVHKKLLMWKQKHQAHLWQWIKIIGEIESLNSLANFAYNNPEYQYPTVSKNVISFENLGHPLLSKEKRVRNDIDFSNQSFVILTGSNMSGKSTFLRTVGINLVLSYVGAPVDTTKAVICSLPLWVSMRLTDSLSDSESFFFAEVKRLKQIVTEAQSEPIFVLLDEILKGTNSDDKKTGTVGVIEKLHQFDVKGMIATHDLEVCNTVDKYPETMINKRFEVEIINDELHFDYQLKEGVCQNKNATFIMKKMEII